MLRVSCGAVRGRDRHMIKGFAGLRVTFIFLKEIVISVCLNYFPFAKQNTDILFREAAVEAI